MVDDRLYIEPVPVKDNVGYYRNQWFSYINLMFIRFFWIVILLVLFVFLSRYDQSNKNPAYYVALLAMISALMLLIYKSEFNIKNDVDGYNRLIIYKNGKAEIHYARRPFFKIKKVFSLDGIETVKIINGTMSQYYTKKKSLYWEESPIRIKLKLKNGKRISLGNKSPILNLEIINVLKNHVKTLNSEQIIKGHATIFEKYNKNSIVEGFRNMGEYSHDEIVNMNLIKWEQSPSEG